jgi:hypothetical protein
MTPARERWRRWRGPACSLPHQPQLIDFLRRQRAIVDAHGDHVAAVMLTIALTAAALQVGYLFGLVMRAVIPSLGVPERNAVMVEKLGHR